MADMNGEAKSKIKSLPHLPVLREDFCPQEIADKVIDELVISYPDNMEQLGWYLPASGLGMYAELFEVMGCVREIKEKFNLSSEPMFYIYLACEILRRMRNAYGLSDEVKVEGVPLAPTPRGPFPPLAQKEIDDELKHYGLNQVQVDKILQEYYADFSEWWYIRGEAARLGLVPYLSDPVQLSYLKQKIDRDLSYLEANGCVFALEAEATRRIKLMCQIP